jgi:hypothetical protein
VVLKELTDSNSLMTRERIKADLAKNPDLAFELITKITARARASADTVRSMLSKMLTAD